MIRKGIRPVIRPALDMAGKRGEFRKVMPFRRAWLAIGILAVFDLVFLIPAITTFQQAATQWGRFDDLFDLVSALFLSAWLLGWSIAPILMTTVLALMLFGREVLRVRPGEVEIFIGLPLIGVAARYRVAAMRNLRLESPAAKSGKSWRGTHLAFDYGANDAAFGSDFDHDDLDGIRAAIARHAGVAVRTGSAHDHELSGRWPTEPAMELIAAQEEEAPLSGATQPLSLASPSALVLIAANLVPLAGSVFWGWQLSDVMVLYWAESGIIGFYNILKMALISRWLAIPAGLFFLSHFGAFMAVHFLFIYSIFVQGLQGGGGDLGDVRMLFVALWPALAALFLSHGLSFVVNFMGRREYTTRSIRSQMSEPYRRIVFMHLVLIFGGGLALILGAPTPVLWLVIVVKIWVDMRAHLKERKRWL